jgi:hypothetical protein
MNIIAEALSWPDAFAIVGVIAVLPIMAFILKDQ